MVRSLTLTANALQPSVITTLRKEEIGRGGIPGLLELEVGEISELLGGVLIDAGQVGSYVINFEAANERALHMINGALVFAEQKIKEEFPTLPDLESISSQRDDKDSYYNQHTQYK